MSSVELTAPEIATLPLAPDPRGSDWRREHACSGITTRLILAYAEKVGGRDAVDEVLARSGRAGRDAELHEEGSWFSYDTKIALWEAAEEVLDDEKVAEHAGESVLDFSIAPGLKRALRALGSPDLVYRNVARANSKFNWAHELVMVERRPGYVRLRYRDVSGVGYHRYDCEYTQGLLATVPQLFGLPPARVTHSVCGLDGGDYCQFDVHWLPNLAPLKRWGAGALAASAALVGAGLLVDPALIGAGVGVGLAGGAAIGTRALLFQRRRIGSLETQVRDQQEAAEREMASLSTISSDLRLDEVLARIGEAACDAIGEKQFALLVRRSKGLQAARHSELPEEALQRLEEWANEVEAGLSLGPMVVDDFADVPALAPLVDGAELALGSCCAVPLSFRDELQGAFIVLAHGPNGLLPGDATALSTYATHAAIAISNARLLDRLERLAAQDPLTGLVNPRAFDQICHKELARSRRDDTPLALLMLDVDHFKEINDACGHPYGDEVLRQIANVLRSEVRPHDAVARLGGEEFAILLPDTHAAQAAEVAERMRESITALPAQLPLTASVGVAICEAGTASYDDLLEEADSAMYLAKRGGRDRVAVSSG
jgi:diguanylate cyclase (GGDEF)-like protein